MRVASQTSIIEKRFGAENAIRMLSEVGFEAYDFTFFGMNENTEKAVYGENYREYMLSLKEISDNKTKVCYVLEWSANPGGNTSILDNTLHNIVSELHLQLLSGLGKDDLVKEFKSGQTKNRAITLLCVGVILIFVFVVFIMK